MSAPISFSERKNQKIGVLLICFVVATLFVTIVQDGASSYQNGSFTRSSLSAKSGVAIKQETNIPSNYRFRFEEDLAIGINNETNAPNITANNPIIINHHPTTQAYSDSKEEHQKSSELRTAKKLQPKDIPPHINIHPKKMNIKGNNNDNNNGDESEDDINNNDESVCWRMCPQRINRIYYEDNAAGLGDRQMIIRDLAELAGYLCAKLVLPRPSHLLNIGHNNGKVLSDELTWEDFDNITFAEDGELVIANDEFDVGLTRKGNVYMYDPNKYRDFHRIVSTDGKWNADFEKVQALSWDQEDDATTGFVWELHDHFYSNDLDTTGQLPRLPKWLRTKLGMKNDSSHHGHGRPHHKMMPMRYHHTDDNFRSRACTYTNDDRTPSHIQRLRERLVEKISDQSLEYSTHGLLHLRRGDAIDDCDTSVDRMREYLSCSLKDTEFIGNITLLMMSDEQDEDYRKAIQDLADDYDYVTIVDIDRLIWQMLDEAIANGELGLQEYHRNNYFVFEIGSMLRTWRSTEGLVKFQLVRRRTICADCISVKRRIHRAWGME